MCIHISHFCLVVIIIIFFYIKCLPSCNINLLLLLWFIFMINLNGRVNDLYNPYMASASAGSFLQVIPVQQQGLRRGLKIVKCNQTPRALLCYVLYWYRCSYTLLCARTCVESLFRTQTAMETCALCLRWDAHKNSAVTYNMPRDSAHFTRFVCVSVAWSAQEFVSRSGKSWTSLVVSPLRMSVSFTDTRVECCSLHCKRSRKFRTFGSCYSVASDAS